MSARQQKEQTGAVSQAAAILGIILIFLATAISSRLVTEKSLFSRSIAQQGPCFSTSSACQNYCNTFLSSCSQAAAYCWVCAPPTEAPQPTTPIVSSAVPTIPPAIAPTALPTTPPNVTPTQSPVCAPPNSCVYYEDCRTSGFSSLSCTGFGEVCCMSGITASPTLPPQVSPSAACMYSTEVLCYAACSPAHGDCEQNGSCWRCISSVAVPTPTPCRGEGCAEVDRRQQCRMSGGACTTASTCPPDKNESLFQCGHIGSENFGTCCVPSLGGSSMCPTQTELSGALSIRNAPTDAELASRLRYGIGIKYFNAWQNIQPPEDSFSFQDLSPNIDYEIEKLIVRKLPDDSEVDLLSERIFGLKTPRCDLNLSITVPEVAEAIKFCPIPNCPAAISFRDQIFDKYGLCQEARDAVSSHEIILNSSDPNATAGGSCCDPITLMGTDEATAVHEFLHAWQGQGIRDPQAFIQDVADYLCTGDPSAYWINLRTFFCIGNDCPVTTCNLDRRYLEHASWIELHAYIGESAHPPAELSGYYSGFFCTRGLQTGQTQGTEDANILGVQTLGNRPLYSSIRPPSLVNQLVRANKAGHVPTQGSAVVVGNVFSLVNSPSLFYEKVEPGIRIQIVDREGRSFQATTTYDGSYLLELPLSDPSKELTFIFRDQRSQEIYPRSTFIVYPGFYYSVDAVIGKSEAVPLIIYPLHLSRGDNQVTIPPQIVAGRLFVDIESQLRSDKNEIRMLSQPRLGQFLVAAKRDETLYISAGVLSQSVSPTGQPSCDHCGYCKGGTKPNDWEQCTQCLANKDHAWLSIGCIPVNPASFIQRLVQFVVGIAGGIAFLAILYGGLLIMTSRGDKSKFRSGRNLIVSSLIALALIVFSVFFLKYIGMEILALPGFK